MQLIPLMKYFEINYITLQKPICRLDIADAVPDMVELRNRYKPENRPVKPRIVGNPIASEPNGC